MLNGSMVSNVRSEQGGVCARVYRNGVYGFASAVEYEEESVRRVLKAAEENALFLDTRVQKGREGGALLVREARIAVIRLRVLEVNLRMRDIEITADDDGLLRI